MLEPIVKRVEVPCNQEKAFKIFIEEMHTWWPVDRFATSKMAGSSTQTINVDTQVGGAITEVNVDGSEYHWGTIKVYDPYAGLTMDFHVPHPDYEIGPMTTVALKFVELDKGRTLVELTQTGWEVFGDMAEGIHGGYTFGWGVILEQAYKDACSK